MKIKNYLSDQEEKELAKLANNPILNNALEKLLLEELYSQGTLKEGISANPLENYAFYLASRRKSLNISFEQIGSDLCAVWEGINLLKNGLKELDKFKTIENTKPQKT